MRAKAAINKTTNRINSTGVGRAPLDSCGGAAAGGEGIDRAGLEGALGIEGGAGCGGRAGGVGAAGIAMGDAGAASGAAEGGAAEGVAAVAPADPRITRVNSPGTVDADGGAMSCFSPGACRGSRLSMSCPEGETGTGGGGTAEDEADGALGGCKPAPPKIRVNSPAVREEDE